MEFTGKVALITGSSSGLGEAIALKLYTLGASVVITGRDQTRIDSVVNKCLSISRQQHQRAIGIRADLLLDSDISELHRKTVAEFRRIDILVNNAGVVSGGGRVSFDDQKYIADYDCVMQTNVRSVQLLTRLSVPYLTETNGNIVNISSVAGLKPTATSAAMAYCMAKSALDMFTKCLALNLAPLGVRVNSVNPATVRTPIFDRFDGGAEHLAKIESNVQQIYPLGRIGRPDDVAEAVVFLASERTAPWITGHIMPVDGGILRSQPTFPATELIQK